MATRSFSTSANSNFVGSLLIALDALRLAADSVIDTQDTLMLNGTMEIIVQVCALIDLADKSRP